MKLGVDAFFKELDRGKRLIDDFKEAILKGMPRNVRGLGEGEAGREALLGALMSVGNRAYRSGNSLVLRHFLYTLLELEEKEPNYVDHQKLSDAVSAFGLRAIRDTDHQAFTAVLGAISDSVRGLREREPIDRRVEALRDLALTAASEGLGDCALEVVETLGRLDIYFEEEGLRVSRVSLRNALVSLVHSLPEGPLREKVATRAEGLLGRGESGGPEAAIEEAVAPR